MHRQQDLCGADIAGGLVPADVLFPSLQRQAIRRGAITVDGHPHQPTGKLAGVLGVYGKVAGMWSAESHWHTETLRAAEGDVGTDFAGRGDQRQRQQIRPDRHQGAALVGLRHQLRPVDHRAAGTGQLSDHTEELAIRQTLAQVGGDDLDAERCRAGGQHGRGLSVHVGVDGQPVRRAARSAVHQRHRLGGGGALVEHRCVGHLQAGQVGDHGLEVQQRLEPALADLRLIRGVCGVPGGILKYVAAQHRRCQRVEIALADHRHRDGVGVGQCTQLGQRFEFGGGRRQLVEAGCDPVSGQRVENAYRQRLVGQFVEGTHADGLEHGGHGVGIRPDVPVGEIRLLVVEHSDTSPDARGRRTALYRCGSSPSVVDPYRAPERFGWPRRDGGNTAFPHGRVSEHSPLSRGIGALRGPGCLRG